MFHVLVESGPPPRQATLKRVLGLLSLHQRFMVVPLLALVLISGLTAGFVHQTARQARLFDRIAGVDLVELDRHADLLNALLIEHLAIQSVLQNTGELDDDAFEAVGRQSLARINDAALRLEKLVAAPVIGDTAAMAHEARHAKLVELLHVYRHSVAAAVMVATIDVLLLPPMIKATNERFSALAIGLEADQDEERHEIASEIGEHVRQSRWVSMVGALSGVGTALLLLALSFALSRRLVQSLERQIRALVALGKQAGAAAPVRGGDEVDRIEHAVAAFRGVLVQLQRSEAEFRTLAEAMPQIVWVTRGDGSVLYVSRVWTDYTGITLDRAVKDGWHPSFHPDDSPGARTAWKAAMAARGNLSFEFRLRRADGVYRWWLLRGAPMVDPGGNILKWFGTCTDIDDLKELNSDLEQRVDARTAELNLARNEAERANLAKSEFLATMSHEIRTPMNGLLGLLELLGLGRLDGQQRASLVVARESGHALLRIIDNILDFSKIEANFLDLDPAPASVRDVVEGACRLHSQIASSKNLSLQVHVAADISPLLAFDALRLGQILNNFLNNAIKFTERGTVDVHVERLGRRGGAEQLRFSVRDTGIGISAEDLAGLFQPFVQANAKTSSRFGGTGLGLVISRRLAELMGGTVEVASEPGRGTIMSLTVAFAVCQAGAEAGRPAGSSDELLRELMSDRRAPPSTRDAEKEGTLLLVVDDHPTNRLVLMQQVASLGYAAEAASDGVEALQLFQSGRFGAVFTDCNMPRMNGYQLAAAIRAHENLHHARAVAVIGCTANALPSAVSECLSAGMDDCMVKPVDLADISRKLEQWCPVPGISRPDTVVPQLLPLAVDRPDPGKGLLDHRLMDAITGGDARTQVEMLTEFRRVNELDTTALRRTAHACVFAEVRMLSHRIKGASLMLGATALAEQCERVEAAGASGDAIRLRSAMDDFEPELLRLNEYVDTLCAGKPPRP